MRANEKDTGRPQDRGGFLVEALAQIDYLLSPLKLASILNRGLFLEELLSHDPDLYVHHM